MLAFICERCGLTKKMVFNRLGRVPFGEDWKLMDGDKLLCPECYSKYKKMLEEFYANGKGESEAK